MIGGTSGSETKLCQPCSSQSKTTQTRSSSEGSRKMTAPLDPCCRRFSAPLVEKISRKRSKFSTCVVASTISISFRVVWVSSGRDDRCGRHERLLRVDLPEAGHDVEAAASRLGDVHVHAHVVLAARHGRGSPGPLDDLRVIECRDHVLLYQRACLR